ncbi:hypothetical protein RB195_008406 [Necator americanus]|uniref:Uncharacterized protein n=1 Tax=Necator americanus TaxID=51031 RepID=A0ABR1CNH4_NECAM
MAVGYGSAMQAISTDHMTRIRQRLRSSEEGIVEYGRLKGLHTQLTSQLESCRQVMEEDLKSNLPEDERLRHVSYFVQALKSSVFSAEMNELLTKSDHFEENFRLQVLETKVHLHEQIEHLIQIVENLSKNLISKRSEANSDWKSTTAGSPKTSTRDQYGPSSNVGFPKYACQQQPGPSGYNSWNCKTSTVTDDGNTAFMVLEETKAEFVNFYFVVALQIDSDSEEIRATHV